MTSSKPITQADFEVAQALLEFLKQGNRIQSVPAKLDRKQRKVQRIQAPVFQQR